ncbi:MAG: hypothetical protein QM764_02545 [Chitinophagaceae bacterium]
MKYWKLGIAFLLLTFTATAQSEFIQFNKERINITRNGMMVLGSWGAVNTITGAIGWATSKGEAKYFHQMNFIWGATNTAIAASSFIGIRKRPTDLSASKTLQAQSAIEKTFLINAGLDLVYISAGIFCKEKAKNVSDAERYKGYGNSLLLQGGGLLLFDAIMYITNTKHGKQLYKLLDKVQFSGSSVGVLLKF